MERQEHSEERDEKIARREESFSGDSGVWSVAAGIALLGLAALVILNLPDIKRYIKMSRM